MAASHNQTTTNVGIPSGNVPLTNAGILALRNQQPGQAHVPLLAVLNSSGCLDYLTGKKTASVKERRPRQVKLVQLDDRGGFADSLGW